MTKEEKTSVQMLGAIIIGVATFGVPIFRSGGRTNLSFYGWVKNHTIFGPPVEYVPEEDYATELLPATISSDRNVRLIV